MNVMMNGTHIEFVHYVLGNMGYSEKALNSLGLYPCLIRLLSPQSTEEIQEFLDSKHEYLQEVLSGEGDLDALIYLLQCFLDPIVWSPNKQTLDELFERAKAILAKELKDGCVIRMGIE
ncbi:hypothetical protein NDZ80_001608 [Vibrio vulnificus]|nr:hypothetical protein [Vibrio vulnificus]